jgi:methanogenic corrinoid protein MtbC1
VKSVPSQRNEGGHPIQVVARRTGLSPDVIRVWERRYAAVSPCRSATRRRLYSDEEIERLRLLRRATLAGRRIGDVASLDDRDLARLVAEDEHAAAEAPAPAMAPSTRTRARLDECVQACRDFDVHAIECALARASVELGAPALIDELLMPLLEAVGEDWRTGRIRPAHEHMASAAVRSLLGALAARRNSGNGAPWIVVGTPSGQRHELGALAAALTATAEGWQVLYLGPDLPAEDLAAAARGVQARAVALSLVHPGDDPRLGTELRTLRQALGPGVEILTGGRAAAGYDAVLGEIAGARLPSLRALRERLERLRA